MGEKEITISQKAFVVSPEGEVIETSRDVTPEKKQKKKTKRSSSKRHAEGVFLNPPGVPTPMEVEIDRVKEEKVHETRGEFLKARKMGRKERKRGLEVYELAEIIENSSQIISWEGNIDDKQILIQLKKISQGDVQRLKELGLEFSADFRWQTGERSPFGFWFDSAFASPRNELPELDIFDLTPFRDKEQAEGRILLFKTEKEEKLFGLAKFGEKYIGIRDRPVEPGFFALVIFLKR